MFSNLSILCVQPSASIRRAIACIDRNSCGIVLLVDDEKRLLDTVTDGDVRRALLAGVDLDSPVTEVLRHKASLPYPHPVTAPVTMEPATLLCLMQERSVRQIPLLDGQGRVVGLTTLDELLPRAALPLQAIVMAGGYGTRLQPLTENLPKPMLPVGNKPLLELVIEQLRGAGIRRVNIATHYKSDIITEHFGDGREFGVEIQYVEEHRPLGTAGALGLLEVSNEPLLVINGDILTRVDFRAMLDFHREHQADMTVAVKRHEVEIPYGVVETNGVQVISLLEKPVLRHFINAGIYLLNPGVCQHVPNGESCDMPDVIRKLIAQGQRVISFPVREYWLDIGQTQDYKQAVTDVENRKF